MAQAPCCNVLTNGNFEAGNTGFTSGLAPNCNQAACATGAYCVGTSFNSKCNLWPLTPGDHTTGSGQFLIVDGSTTAATNVWINTVNVTDGTTYCFCFWAASLYDQSFDLGMMIGGVNQSTVTVSQVDPVWTKYCVDWTATTTGSVTIAIRQLSAGAFRDFGIDDIEFGAPIVPNFAYSPDLNCGMNVSFFSQSTGPAPLTYMWSFGDPNSGTANMSTFQNPIHKFTDCGTYEVCLTVKRGTCSATICQTVIVEDNEPPTALCAGVGVELDANCMATISPGSINGGSFDNCYLASLSVSPSVITGCGFFPVTLTVRDSCGNTSSCTVDVQAGEAVPPTLTCPPSISVNAVPATCAINVNGIGLLTVADNCSVPTVMYVITGATAASGTTNASGLLFNQGMSTITYTAKDACDNTASCTFKITVTCDVENCVGCTGTPPGPNLVANGNFSGGAVGFTSGLNGPSASCATNNYGIATNLSIFCPGWPSLGANSAPNFLAIDGSDNAGPTILWQSPVSLVANTNYCFSFVWASVFPVAQQSFPIELVCLDAGGSVILPAFPLATITRNGPIAWTPTNITFTAPPGTVSIGIRQLTGSLFRDFGIDDICLRAVPAPCVVDAGQNVTICAGQSTTLTATGGAAGTTYLWSPGGATNASISVNPSTTTTYTVTSTLNGCIATDQVTVTVLPKPTPTITGNLSVCSGSSTVLTVTGGGTYLWSNNATTASITVTPPIQGGTYTVVVTGANGCTASTSVAVSVLPLPAFVLNNQTICQGASATLTAAGGGTYLWSLGGATTASITVTPNVTTTYTATVTGTNGCTGTGSATVTVLPRPTPTITGNLSVCSGSSTVLTATGGGTYLWSNTATTASITVTPPIQGGTYTVVVTGANGCTASTSVAVTVLPAPAFVLNNQTICQGASTTLTAAGGGTYLWSLGGATTASITVTPNVTSTYTATVTGTNGCTGTGSATVTVLPRPVITITGNLQICAGDCTTLTATGTGTNCLWNTSQSGSSIQVCPPATTTYTVTCTDMNGCTGTASATVTVVDCGCPDNILKNGNFEQGTTSGNLGGAGSTVCWIPIYTPQVVTTDGNCIQMWGNQVVGEGIQQATNFQHGCTYKIEFSAKYLNINAISQGPRVRFRASTAASVIAGNYSALTPNATLIWDSPVLTPNWQRYTHIWTAPTTTAFPGTMANFAATVWNNSNQFNPSLTSWVRLDSICITKIECPSDYECGPFVDLGFGYEKGPFKPANCGNTSPVILQCPISNQRFYFTGAFSCLGGLSTSAPVNWEIWKNNVFTGVSGLANATPFFSIPLQPGYFTAGGVYELRLVGHCGDKLCPCVIKFEIPPCLDNCPCDNTFKKDVAAGFYQTFWKKYCRMCFTPIKLKPCDRVEWSIVPTDTSYINPVGNTLANGTFCFTFSQGGTYTITMHVFRQRPDGTICEASFSKKVTIKCNTILDCNNLVFANPNFDKGADTGVLGVDGSSDDWFTVSGSPVVKDTSDTGGDNWSIMLAGNDDTYDAIRTEDAYCFEKDTGTITLRAMYWGKTHDLIDSGPMIFFNLVRGDNYATWPCEGDNCYEIACLQLPEGTDDWVEFQFDYDLRDLTVSDQCSGSTAPRVNLRPVIYVGNLLSDEQGGTSTYTQVLIDNVCLDGKGISPTTDPIGRSNLRIFPNPNTGTFRIELPQVADADMRFRVTDLAGRVVLDRPIETGAVQQTVQAGNLPNGLYFLQVLRNGIVVATEKFVKQ